MEDVSYLADHWSEGALSKQNKIFGVIVCRDRGLVTVANIPLTLLYSILIHFAGTWTKVGSNAPHSNNGEYVLHLEIKIYINELCDKIRL